MSIPNTFSDFDTAVKAAVNFDGIGTRASRNLALIDLDHCVDNGITAHWAQEVVDHFPDAYVEISPSRTGIHIICKVSDDFVFDRKTFSIKKGNYELYIAGYTNRFLTVTGDCIKACCVVFLLRIAFNIRLESPKKIEVITQLLFVIYFIFLCVDFMTIS